MESEVAVDALRADLKVEGDALLADYVQRYRRLIERLCRILLGDSGDAEDAAQQTFLLAYQSLLSGTRPHHPRAWLCTIARRECWAREHRRRRERAVARPETRTEPDPAERTVLRAELATISAGLEQLPARQRQAIVLREMAGLSYTQLAAALKVSESAAEALLVRARRNLRDARLGLILLWPFPHRLRRLFRTGSGHAQSGAGAAVAKAVAAVTIVAATTAVAGSAAPVERAANPVAKTVARTAPPRAHIERAAQRSAVRRGPVARRARPVRSASVAAVQPTVSSAPVRQSLPTVSQEAVTESAPQVAPTPARPTVRDAAPKAQPRAPKPRTPRPQPTAQHPKPKPSPPRPAPKAAAPVPPAPSTTEPDPAAAPPPPAETTETPPPTAPEDPAGSASGNESGDTKPGNGYGDEKHDHEHDGDHGHGKH
jgi:RNA polymerase sigma factor (sigma-70 family)